MNALLQTEIERVLALHAGHPVTFVDSAALGGGCINDARRVETSAGTFFLKSNTRPLPRLFETEAAGLRALHAVGVIEVPEPIAYGGGEGGIPPYLLTTYIQSAPRAPDFHEDFGRRFARLHREGRGTRYGFDHDNYLGSTPQPNGWSDDWVTFWRERRLGYQLHLAARNGYGGELQRLGGRLLDRLDGFLAEPAEPPALLHGDLWSGNYITGPGGHAALIDPAAYYGRREADLAMTMLFGGFDRSFYDAYKEEWPLAAGSRDRIDLYTLYHLLNHLNLFGRSYLTRCVELMQKLG